MAPVSRRIHPGWIAVAVTFATLMATAGFRSAPSVLIVPLEVAFGWSRSDISLAVAINQKILALKQRDQIIAAHRRLIDKRLAMSISDERNCNGRTTAVYRRVKGAMG